MNVEKMLEHQFGAKVTMGSLAGKLRGLAAHKRRGQISVILWGPPGVGKTSITKQIAAQLGIGYRRYDLPTTDYIQLGGIPELVADPRGNKHAVRYPILDIPSEGEGIFVLDDFTHAPTTVQNLALDLALEHRLNDAVLGQGWMLILCANDTGNVFPMQIGRASCRERV
jgi:MoxR-like ATPase